MSRAAARLAAEGDLEPEGCPVHGLPEEVQASLDLTVWAAFGLDVPAWEVRLAEMLAGSMGMVWNTEAPWFGV